MSSTSVDFPEPDTPVTTMKSPSGNLTSMFFRLFARAPSTSIALPFELRRSGGTGIDISPDMNRPVSDAGF